MSNTAPGPAGVLRRRRGRSLNGLALQLSAVALSFTLVALLVVHTSKQAFAGTTANNSNNVSAGTVTLTDTFQPSTAMFAVTGAVPNHNYDQCIVVKYTGSYTPVTPVQLYGLSSQAPGGTLAPYLNLQIDMAPTSATTDTAGSCTNFTALGSVTGIYNNTLSSFYTSRPSYLTSGTTQNTWQPASTNDLREFRFRITVVDNPTNGQGQSATNFGFTWETRSQ